MEIFVNALEADQEKLKVLKVEQLKDDQLKEKINYIEKVQLLEDQKKAKRLILDWTGYEIEDWVLYRILPNENNSTKSSKKETGAKLSQWGTPWTEEGV